MSRLQQQENRREMFRTSARYLALGGIGLLSAGLIVRAANSPAEDCCRQLASCRDCAAIARCGLPSALAEKKRTDR